MRDNFRTSMPRATMRIMMATMEGVHATDSTAILRICSALTSTMAAGDLEGLLARLEGTGGGGVTEAEEIERLRADLGM